MVIVYPFESMTEESLQVNRTLRHLEIRDGNVFVAECMEDCDASRFDVSDPLFIRREAYADWEPLDKLKF